MARFASGERSISIRAFDIRGRVRVSTSPQEPPHRFSIPSTCSAVSPGTYKTPLITYKSGLRYRKLPLEAHAKTRSNLTQLIRANYGKLHLGVCIFIHFDRGPLGLHLANKIEISPSCRIIALNGKGIVVPGRNILNRKMISRTGSAKQQPGSIGSKRLRDQNDRGRSRSRILCHLYRSIHFASALTQYDLHLTRFSLGKIKSGMCYILLIERDRLDISPHWRIDGRKRVARRFQVAEGKSAVG